VEGGLRYRGYPVTELAERASFEEVAYLLLHGDLPIARQLADFQKRVAAARQIPEALRNLLKAIPRDTVPMAALRSAPSVLSLFHPKTTHRPRGAKVRKAGRLWGYHPVAVADQHRNTKGLPLVPPRADLSNAANFLYMVRGQEPSTADLKAFDVSLILYAEHE